MGQKLLGLGGLAVAVLIGGVVFGGSRARSEVRPSLVDPDPVGTEQLLAQSRELDEALDELEVRLFAGRTTVRLWSEMASRHQHVSALACGSADMHSEAMASLQQRTRGRAAAQKLAAARSTVTSDARGTGYLAPGAAPVSSGRNASSKLVP